MGQTKLLVSINQENTKYIGITVMEKKLSEYAKSSGFEFWI